MKKFIKKLLILSVITAMVVTAMPLGGIDINLLVSASAETGKSTENLKGLQYTDEYAYRAYSDYGIYIFKYIGEAEEYFEIPSEIDGYTVEVIGEKAFSPSGTYSLDTNTWLIPKNESLNNLKEISIPPTVTKISSDAFMNCKNLEKVNFSEGLVGISYSAFKGCEKITSFDFPCTLNYIYSGNFKGTAVTEVNFKKCTGFDGFDISGSIFSGSNVAKCTVQNDNVRVWKNAFINSVLKEIIFEGTITLWEDKAFDSDNNTVEKIVFKAGMPEGLYESLINDYGYYVHADATDGAIYFDKNPENENCIASGDFVYTLNEDLQAIITRHTGTKADVTVPETIDGYTVAQIGGFAFAETQIESVALPESIKKIGIYAFYACDMLEKITVPSDLTELNGYAFCGCTSLKSFDIPDGLSYLGAYAFNRCESIEKIHIPDSINEIYNGVFMGCTGLKEVEMSSNVRTIGISSFEGTTSLTEIDLPESLVIIDDRAFHSSGIKSIVLPESLEYLMEMVFDSSSIVTAVIDGKDLDLGTAFDDCLQLETVEIKNGVREIWGGAFCNCPSLKTVIIAENLKKIELYAFSKCVNLETVYYNATNCEVNTNLENPKLSVFENCNPENIYIGDNVEYLGAALFMNCDTIESIKIPDSVTTVDRYAFYGCDSLSSVEWNAERKIIKRKSFAGCPNLTEFNFDNIEKSYSNSFTGSGIVKAQLGKTENETSSALEAIDEQSFMKCGDLSTVGIGGNVTTIKTQAFAECTNLETAVIADSVTEIAEDAFDGCDKLTIYCSENSYAHSYAQTQGINVSTFVIAPIPNQTYTGFEIKPAVSVSASGDKLAENVDFGVTYANNINVGNADVTVKGKGDFRMFASRAKFTIVTKSIADVSISPIPDQLYTGSPVTPEITVIDGLKLLRESTDYTVTYADNVNEGTASAKITGIGNYSGTASTDFQISKEAEEPSLFDKILSSISSFFAKIISFILGIFL